LLVLVDTSVWIEYFQRKDALIEKEMDGLLRSEGVATAGLVLAELRQGCRAPNQVRLMLDAMEPLLYLESDRTSWLKAGEIAAEASARGYKLEVGDCLLAAVALRERCSLFTLDRDFSHIPGLKLYRFRSN
jgi:predicted nucleic acid-binding protein